MGGRIGRAVTEEESWAFWNEVVREGLRFRHGERRLEVVEATRWSDDGGSSSRG